MLFLSPLCTIRAYSSIVYLISLESVVCFFQNYIFYKEDDMGHMSIYRPPAATQKHHKLMLLFAML